jgi:hypothetical protein
MNQIREKELSPIRVLGGIRNTNKNVNINDTFLQKSETFSQLDNSGQDLRWRKPESSVKKKQNVYMYMVILLLMVSVE